jgi:predicted ATPase/DNA-binding XRE family transcriptional regulator/Tfp pilus assembly protein PilF
VLTELVTELAELLRRERAAAGLTQEALAERSGVSARTISDTERGTRRRIYNDTARRIADALALDDVSRAAFMAAARGRSAPLSLGLPRPATPLIGRERELALVRDALASARIVVLTGPGGVGKSRLATEAAAAGGGAVVFVQLAGVSDSALVAPAVAQALGAGSMPGPSVNAIAAHVGTAPLLLVCDTFERVLTAAPFVAELVERCPDLRVLATSREPLRLRAEREIPVPTLDAASAAARLFTERARMVTPDIELDAQLVAAVCERLSGLPLAIELAAARLRHLSLRSLADHLERGLDILSGGARDLPARQRTMRDTVAWSYELLDEAEREVFTGVSIFAGGWSHDAATSVLGHDVFDELSALVDKSLVYLSNERYEMLDVIHEFAAEQGIGEKLGDRHSQYYLALAEKAEPEFGGSAQDVWYGRVEAEHDNMRAALRRAIDTRDGELAVRLAGALWQFWRAHAHFDEGRAWLRSALALDSTGRARAKALWGAAWLAYHQDDYRTADDLSVELLALARRDEDPVDTRNGLTIRGMVAMAERRFAEAVKSFEEALDLCRPLGTVWLAATSYLNLATATMHAGELERAQDLFETALSLYTDLGDKRFILRSRTHLAQIALTRGDVQDAIGRASAVVRDALDFSDESPIAEAMETLSAVFASSRAEEAAYIAGAVEVLRETMPLRRLPFDADFVDRRLAAAHESIGDERWFKAWADGRGTPLEDAITRVLGNG